MKEHPPAKPLTASAENYLEAVLMIEEKQGEAHAVDVARKLNFTKPSVSVALHQLEAAGYLTFGEGRSLCLTAAGREIAERVYEKHCFITNALVCMGVSPRTAEEDACKIEHDISEETFLAAKACGGCCAARS